LISYACRSACACAYATFLVASQEWSQSLCLCHFLFHQHHDTAVSQSSITLHAPTLQVFFVHFSGPRSGSSSMYWNKGTQPYAPHRYINHNMQLHVNESQTNDVAPDCNLQWQVDLHQSSFPKGRSVGLKPCLSVTVTRVCNVRPSGLCGIQFPK
jgi:hypothetical protein